jgi:hypothetical protein
MYKGTNSQTAAPNSDTATAQYGGTLCPGQPDYNNNGNNSTSVTFRRFSELKLVSAEQLATQISFCRTVGNTNSLTHQHDTT